MKRTLTDLEQRDGVKDPRYYADGVWVDGTASCFRCAMGPSVLASVQAVTQADAGAYRIAVDSLDHAIKNHQGADGAFVPPAPTESGPDIQTVLFANELAASYLILEDRLDAKHKKRWSTSLTKSADWLINNGNLTFYTNGNINLANAVNMDLTWRITHHKRFRDAARRSINFTLAPPQQRWKGFGLHYSKTPTADDGSDGAGYLAETGGAVPGLDIAYTLAQADIASFWYLLTDSATAKRLTNLFTNQALPHVRTSDYTIDINGGTRRGAPGVRYPFAVSAIPVLVLKGGRSDLRRLLTGQVQAMLKNYQDATRYPHSALSTGYGGEMAPAALAVLTARE